jgi:hypothetical protein
MHLNAATIRAEQRASRLRIAALAVGLCLALVLLGEFATKAISNAAAVAVQVEALR